MHHRTRSGFSRTPPLVLLGIIGLSSLFFLLFTGRLGFPGVSPGGSPTASSSEPSAGFPPAAGTVPSKSTTDAPRPAPPKKPGASTVVYGKANDLLEAVGAELRAGDLENAMKLAGKDFAVLPATNFWKLLLTKGGFKVPDSGTIFSDAGSVSPSVRYSVALEPAAESFPKPAGPLWVDAQRDRTTGSWKLTQVIVSRKLLEQGLAELRRNGVMADPADLQAPMDPLQHAHEFLAAVFGGDFRTARLLTDRQKVAQEKLAGLCIVFEEGGYALTGGRAVVVTAASRDAAIALVRVRSAKTGTEAEIGITLHSSPEAQGWSIQALDFSRLLETYVQQSGAGKVFYSPVVQSPQGGESLVVYFDFNSASLVPRAVAQLKIVAGLLATDPARKLRISGHADDLGSEDFNYRLSAMRAKNVREHLHRLGVNPSQIETIGFGATAPLDPNRQSDGSDNPEGRSRNRRTEIYLDF